MIGSLVIGAESVIMVPDSSSYSASRPVYDGLGFVSSLIGSQAGRVVILAGIVDVKTATYWCRMNGMVKASVIGIDCADEALSAEIAQWHQIQKIRANGPIGLVVTAFTEVFDLCLRHHQSAALFGRKGGINPSSDRASWGTITNTLKSYRDARLPREPDEEDDPNYYEQP